MTTIIRENGKAKMTINETIHINKKVYVVQDSSTRDIIANLTEKKFKTLISNAEKTDGLSVHEI